MEDDKDRFSGDTLHYAGAGFEFAGAVMVFSLIGFFIDRTWRTQPFGVLIGALAGFVVGCYLIIKAAVMSNKEDEEGRKK